LQNFDLLISLQENYKFPMLATMWSFAVSY